MKLPLTSLTVLSLYSSIANAYTYGLGKSWLIGQGSNSSIQKVTTTFNPGIPPPGQISSLKLYPGLSNGTGDLFLTSIESWPDQSWCRGTIAQWCIRTQVFSHQEAIFGQFAPLNANQSLSIVFERNPNSLNWTQSVTVNDQVVSEASSISRITSIDLTGPSMSFCSCPMTLFGMTTECDGGCAMTVSPQIYSNTTIELSAPDLNWNSTEVVGSQIYGGEGVYNIIGQQPTVVTGLSSQDGQVWTVEEIVIPALN
ncbi:hypothetical protein A7U60_g6256 [Sanghuangporus baumii]|uniref:Uncharacterized protein n=1 Tax=Sanghuangporus baumii TaxID=108892 RepID=A0A9Q5HVD9_SANBA|nr:hypothetical protein A7U60_g6256 [Sanghuangporus baumii]